MTDLNEILKQPNINKPKRNFTNLRNITMALGSVLLVLGTGALVAYLIINNNPNLIGSSKDATDRNITRSPQEELNEVLEKVGKLILLPNEIPTLLTISNLSELTDQAFFVNAQIGDNILMFQETKKAIIYRPGENIIIEVGTVAVEDINKQEVKSRPGVNQEPTLTPTPTLKVSVSPTVLP